MNLYYNSILKEIMKPRRNVPVRHSMKDQNCTKFSHYRFTTSFIDYDNKSKQKNQCSHDWNKNFNDNKWREYKLAYLFFILIPVHEIFCTHPGTKNSIMIRFQARNLIFRRTCSTYTQGQSLEPRIREYFYYIDHQGMVCEILVTCNSEYDSKNETRASDYSYS